MKITSEVAIIACLVSMLGAFVFSTFFPTAPFEVFALQVGVITVAFITKRLIQKQGKYNGEK